MSDSDEQQAIFVSTEEEVTGPTPAGKVYLFNASLQLATMTLNGNAIRALVAASSSTKYVPAASTPYARVISDTTTLAIFANNNNLTVQTLGDVTNLYQVQITAAGQTDVQIYIFSNHLVVSTGTSEQCLTPVSSDS
jgi:hypothetical protein